MLILSRKKDESCIISHNVIIEVASIKGKSVKLRIRAPKEILIYRKELYLKIKRQTENPSLPLLPLSSN